MRYGFAASFAVKWLGTVASVLFVGLFFPLYGIMNWVHMLLLGTVITLLGYLADLAIPRAVNHIAAIFADFALAALVAYLGNYLLPGMRVTWTFATILGLLVAGVEIFYHAKFIRYREM